MPGSNREAVRQAQSAPPARSSSARPASAGAGADADLVLGRYRLLRRLGEGGMGVVWLADDTRLQRRVAVKRIAAGGDAHSSTPKRAGREAVAAARLAHPSIVALYEAGRDDDGWVLVCELVRGATLQTLLREGALSDLDVARIGITMCDALEHAHARGVVHRDIKPANVICPDRPDEAGAVAKLTDFGVARLAGDDALTRTGDVLGTLAYMAPEQARGRPAGPPADVYALGIVLYEALTGINPRRGTGTAETARLVDAPVAPLARVRRDLPERLCAAIDAAVAPEPRERPTPSRLRAALTASCPELDDVPGVVDGGPIEAVSRTVRASGRLARDATQVAAGRWQPALAPERIALAPGFADEPAARRPGHAVPARLMAGAAGGGLAGVALAAAPSIPAGPPAPLAALIVGVAIALLPRLAWVVAALGAVVVTAAHAPGAAVLLGAALLPVPLLLPRSGTAWSAPSLAVGLGVLGLAGAFPALAGQARRASARAALGALGAWWVLLAAAPLGQRVHLGAGGPPWSGSAADAFTEVLAPLVTGGALILVGIWAVGALVLPALVRGRHAAADIAAAAGWTAGLAAATDGIASALALPTPHGLVAGAVVAGVLAVAASAAGEPG